MPVLTKKRVIALDLGTTKFCLALLFIDRAGQLQLEVISVAAAGMRRGMLSDLAAAERALQELIERAESQLNIDIDRVAVGIAGSHLASQHISSQITLPNEQVGQSDIDLLDHQVRSHYNIKSRELLHAIPRAYRIDNREPVDHPIGFTGNLLTGEYLLIDADKSYLKDVVRLCNSCGLLVDQLLSEPFASASVTVADEQKQYGVAIADIGGGTTDGIVFLDGLPDHCFTVNIGGVLMTKDLAIGLNAPESEAERIKHFVLSLHSRQDYASLIEYRTTSGKMKSVTYEKLLRIIVPRLDELAKLLVEQLSAYRGKLKAGLLLTGGGSRIDGLSYFFASRFQIDVQKSDPMLVVSVNEKKRLPTGVDPFKRCLTSEYATVLGLLNLELDRQMERAKSGQPFWPKKYISQFVNWLRELS